MTFILNSRGQLYSSEGSCEGCGGVGQFRRFVQLSGEQRETALYACTLHANATVLPRHVWPTAVDPRTGVDHSAAYDVSVMLGSTAGHVASLILEKGEDAAYGWADSADGPYSRLNRQSVVERVRRLLA